MARIANLIATGRYIPTHRVTNEELQARFAALGKSERIAKPRQAPVSTSAVCPR